MLARPEASAVLARLSSILEVPIDTCGLAATGAIAYLQDAETALKHGGVPNVRLWPPCKRLLRMQRLQRETLLQSGVLPGVSIHEKSVMVAQAREPTSSLRGSGAKQAIR